MGILYGTEEENEEENPTFLQSFSAPYSPSFYLNNKIFDKNKTIKSAIEESLQENDYKIPEIEKIDDDSNNKIINISFDSMKNNNLNKINNEKNKSNNENIKIEENNLSTSNSNNNLIFPEYKSQNIINNDNEDNDEYNSLNKPLSYKSSSLQKDIRSFYKFKGFLGEGHFASVRTAFKRREYSSHKLFAVKSIALKNLTEREKNDLIREVEIISQLEHPHIIKFYETFHDKFYFHIITELCRGNNLNKRFIKFGRKMKEEYVRIIIMKILHAINYCHSFGIVHRDLKPENIVFESPNDEDNYNDEEEQDDNNSNIKIIDFGLSTLKNKTEKLHTILGTPYYMAPEVLKGEYNEKCDIWSIGAIAYFLLSGSEPFKGETSNSIFSKILFTEPNYNSEKFKNTSQNAIDFIKKCFLKDPDKRISAKDGLTHYWFEPLFKKIYAPKFIDDNLLYNISTTKKYSQLKRLIMRYMIYNMGHTELSVYKKAFLAFDKYNNGYITPDELKNLFKIYHKPLNDEQIKNIMSISENNIFLTYNEFIMACLRMRDFLSPEKLFDAFLFFDIDNNDIIDSNDIYLTLLRWGKDATDKNDVENIIYFGTKKKYKSLDLSSFIDFFSDEINKSEYIVKINKIKKEMKENKDNKDFYEKKDNF